VIAVTSIKLLKPWARWAARAALVGRSRSRDDPRAGRFTRGEVDRLLAAAWANFDRLAPDVPRQPSLGSRASVRRMRTSVGMFLRYPFNRPGYRRADVPVPRGRGFDILYCPIAEYLAAHDASDLALATWCNLDFQLARMWGGELERHGTIAGGAERCDFRFRAAGPAVPGR
jgi:hypothetical protein